MKKIVKSGFTFCNTFFLHLYSFIPGIKIFIYSNSVIFVFLLNPPLLPEKSINQSFGGIFLLFLSCSFTDSPSPFLPQHPFMYVPYWPYDPPPFYNRKMFIINDYQPLSKSRTTKREHFPCVTIASLNCSLVGTSLFGPFSSFTEGSSSMWLVGGVSSFNERKYLKINSMTKISLSHFWKPGWPLKKTPQSEVVFLNLKK